MEPAAIQRQGGGRRERRLACSSLQQSKANKLNSKFGIENVIKSGPIWSNLLSIWSKLVQSDQSGRPKCAKSGRGWSGKANLHQFSMKIAKNNTKHHTQILL